MSEYKRTIEITAYRTPGRTPCCALDFQSGKVCKFVGTTKFGTVEVCRLDNQELQRGDNGKGYLVPTDSCIVWSNHV